jgi:ketosteroid isomerase-like protein
MTTNDTRRVARAFFEHLDAGRFDQAAALRAPESVWTLPESLPFGGPHGIDEIDAIQSRLYARFESPPRLTIHAITAEGERAAVELEALARTRDGATYHQHYHFLLIVRGGLIQRAREYLDTLHVHEVLLRGRVEPADPDARAEPD